MVKVADPVEGEGGGSCGGIVSCTMGGEDKPRIGGSIIILLSLFWGEM